MSSPLVNHLT